VVGGHQALGFFLDHRIALATQLLKLGPVEHGDLTARIFNYAQPKQPASGLCDAFTAYPEVQAWTSPVSVDSFTDSERALPKATATGDRWC